MTMMGVVASVGRATEEGASRQSRAVDRLAEYELGLPSAGLAPVLS